MGLTGLRGCTPYHGKMNENNMESCMEKLVPVAVGFDIYSPQN